MLPSARPSASSSDPRVERTRAAALDAARAILLEDGWDAVTQDRVAKRSGVGRATIYRHWPERVSLLRDALAEEAVSLAISPTCDLRGDLLTFLEALRYELVDKNLGRVLATIVDRAEWDPDVHSLRVDMLNDGLAPVRQLLQGALDAGELRPRLDLNHALARLVGPIIYARLLSTEEIGSEFLTAIVDTFLATAQVERSSSKPAPGRTTRRTSTGDRAATSGRKAAPRTPTS